MMQESYRYYCLDRRGKLYGAERFEARSDADAIAKVEAKHPDAMCEIWLGQRLVAKLSALTSPASVRSNAAGRAIQV